MKITSIEPQRRKNRVNIYVDNVFSIGIDEELKFKYNLVVGMEIDDDFIKEILEAEELNKVKNYALRQLSYRQRSEKELFSALRRKGFDEKHIGDVMEYCRKNKYLDDIAFAQSFISDKLNLNKYGPERIRYELLMKGVSKDIIEKYLNIDSNEEYDLAFSLAEKRLNSYKKDDKNSKYRKLTGYLHRKGYSYETTTKVVKELLKD